MILLILNVLDFILTLLNRNNFTEANPAMQPFVNNTFALVIFKLIIVPIFIYILYKNWHRPLVKISYVLLCLVYLYAVILGILIYASP